MKTIPFDLDKALSGKYKIITREGDEVHSFTFIAENSIQKQECLAGRVGDDNDLSCWYADGSYVEGNSYSDYDLFLLDEKTENYREWKPLEVPIGAVARSKKSPDTKMLMCWSGATMGISIVVLGTMVGSSGFGMDITTKTLLKDYEVTYDNGKTWHPCGIKE